MKRSKRDIANMEWMHREGTTPDGRAWAFAMPANSDLAELTIEMFSGTDRALAVAGGAYLEKLLRKALEEFFVDDKDAQSRLLDARRDGDLSKFASMADMTFLVGLISKDVLSLLKTMAKIRNRFAHDYAARSFTDLLSDKDSQKELNKLKLYTDQYIIASDGVDVSSVLGNDFRSRYLTCFNTLRVELVIAKSRATEQRRTEWKSSMLPPSTQRNE
jgi:hypothetical protein